MPVRSPRHVCRSTALAALAAVALLAGPASACTGDCDGNLVVGVPELVRAVNIALGLSPVAECAAIDDDSSGDASIGELIAAVNGALRGCDGAPTPTAANTHTATPLQTATATPSPTPSEPPVAASIYRSFPGFPIRVVLADPQGGTVQCTADELPAGASVESETNTLLWTPAEDQLGPFYVPFSCTDSASPTASFDSQLTLRIAALDACAIPHCEPATGCTTTLRPVGEPCCAAGPVARVAEPVADCPEGRVLYIGRNASIDTFGRLQNCDILPVTNFAQSGAEVQFHVETRCMNTLNRLSLTARMESNAANHSTIFNTQALPYLFGEYDDGFARHRSYRFGVNGPGPFFDVEGAEANLTLQLRDSDNTLVTQQIRVRLTFTPRPDLPDVDPSPSPTR